MRLGIDLGGTKLLLLVDGAATHLPTGPAFSPSDLVDAIAKLPRPSAIGLAVPGLVDADGRIAACDVLPLFAGWNAHEALADLACPIAVSNDAKAAAAEEFADLPAGATAALVMAGTAIGAAFLVGGQWLRGIGGFAGELGYLPIAVDARVERLDECAGGGFIAARLGIDGATLAARAAAGDAGTLAAIEVGGAALGLGLAAIVNLFNPERIAVGGGALDLPGYWAAAACNAARLSLPDLWKGCELRRAGGSDPASLVARGALRGL